MTLTAQEIQVSLEEVVAHADDELDHYTDKADEVKENFDGEWSQAPDELRKSHQQFEQEAARQQEVLNRTLLAIENHFLPDGGDVSDIEDSTITFKELNVGDGVDMNFSAGLSENATQQEKKRAEREMMAMYLNKMHVDSPDEIPDDLQELPLPIGEGIFNVLNTRLEEGNTNLSASQIREVTETSSTT